MTSKVLMLAGALLFAVASCKGAQTSVPTTTTTTTTATTTTATPPPTSPSILSQPELKYKLIAHYGGVFFCDPDFFPIGREGQEQQNALDQFPAIKADADEFAAILGRLGLPNKPDYTAEEKLSIYREHKKLKLGVDVAASGNVFSYTLRIGEDQGYRIEGTVTTSGVIKETKRETSFNTCPICLAKGTLIDTPDGAVPVEQLAKGMSIWTTDESGKRVAGVVLGTSATPVPPSFRVVRVTLSDGRAVTASPGHPSAAGKPLGDYQVGDALDGALVVASEGVAYDAGATYDVAPSGGAGV